MSVRPVEWAAWRQCRRLGLIGGMSWRSTALYHERLNRAAEHAFGAHAGIVGQIDSLDYAELLMLAARGDEAAIESRLVDAALRLRRAGCDVIALTAVTAHRWHAAVVEAVGVPVPHVLASVATQSQAVGYGDIGVLGTELTCRSEFVRHHLGEGRRLLYPDARGQSRIDDLIQKILTVQDAGADGRNTLAAVAHDLQAQGARAILLACTELPLLLPVAALDLPVIDSVALHIHDIFDHICE